MRQTIFTLLAFEMALISELLNNVEVRVVNDVDEQDGSEPIPNPMVDAVKDAVVDKETFGNDEVVDFLTNDCGLNLSEPREYEETAQMVMLSTDEILHIKREMDVLRVRANEGEELARKVRSLHDEFFPQE